MTVAGKLRTPGWRLTAAVAAVVVLPLAVLTRVGWQPLTRLDRRTDDDAYALVVSHRWLLSAVRALTHVGDPVVVTALSVVAAVVAVLVGRRRVAGYLLLVRGVAVVVGFALKEGVRRARPALAHPLAHAAGFSFPSGHALGSASTYASVVLVLSPRMPTSARMAVGLLVPIVVATTRVLLGLHFASDVLAGLVLGWAVALLLLPVGGDGHGVIDNGDAGVGSGHEVGTAGEA